MYVGKNKKINKIFHHKDSLTYHYKIIKIVQLKTNQIVSEFWSMLIVLVYQKHLAWLYLFVHLVFVFFYCIKIWKRTKIKIWSIFSAIFTIWPTSAFLISMIRTTLSLFYKQRIKFPTRLQSQIFNSRCLCLLLSFQKNSCLLLIFQENNGFSKKKQNFWPVYLVKK